MFSFDQANLERRHHGMNVSSLITKNTRDKKLFEDSSNFELKFMMSSVNEYQKKSLEKCSFKTGHDMVSIWRLNFSVQCQ